MGMRRRIRACVRVRACVCGARDRGEDGAVVSVRERMVICIQMHT